MCYEPKRLTDLNNPYLSSLDPGLCPQHNPTMKKAAAGDWEREGAQTQDTMGLFIGSHTRGFAAKKPRPGPAQGTRKSPEPEGRFRF